MQKIFKRDWRKPEDYESLREYSLDKWAWEFLRRNPEYFREYQELTKGMDEIQAMGAAFFPGYHKWDLSGWLDPSREYTTMLLKPPGGTEAVISSADFPEGKGVFFQFAGENTGEVLFRFDTRKPINPQIEIAKKELLKLQRSQNGQRQAIFKPRTFGGRDEWITLLRILDATSEGIKPKAIAEAFYPNEEISSTRPHRIKEISDKIKQAKRYTTDEYRLIPFLNN